MEPTPTEYSAGGSSGNRNNSDLGGSGTIILSNDEVLAMTRSSTISIGSVLEATKKPSRQMNMKKQQQEEEDSRKKQQERELREQAMKQQQQQQQQKQKPHVQQQHQRKSDSQVVSSTSGTKSEKEEEDIDDRLCVTLSNDEILAITRSDSVATTTGGTRTSSSRISTATVDPMILAKEKEKNARRQHHQRGSVGIPNSHTTPIRASTNISTTKDLTSLRQDIGQAPLMEPSSPVAATAAAAAKAADSTTNANNNNRTSTTTVTGPTTKSSRYSSAASSSTTTTTRLSPIMGLADAKKTEKASMTASSNVSRISLSPARVAARRSHHLRGGGEQRQRSISPTTIDEKDRSLAGGGGGTGKQIDDNDNNTTAATSDDEDQQPQILPGAVRVAGIGKTNTKDSIIALFPGVEEEDSMFMKEDDGLGSSTLMMKSTSKEDQKSTEFAFSNRSSNVVVEEESSKKIGKDGTTTTSSSGVDDNEEENSNNNNGTVTAKAISQEELEQEVLQKYNLQQQDQKSRDLENQHVLVPEAAMAVIVTEEELHSGRRNNRKWLICGSLLFAIIAIVVAVVVVLGSNGDGDQSSADLVHGDSHDDVDDHGSHDEGDNDGDHSIGLPTTPTLQRIQERGYLKCRASPEDIVAGHGITVELCAAISAAIFGIEGEQESDHGGHEHTHSHEGLELFYEYVDMPFEEQFDAISHGTIDIVTASTVYTMERDILEPFSSHGYTFSDPYFYAGTVFAGIPEYVTCAENGDSLVGVCRNLQVCIVEGSNSESVTHDHLKGTTVHHVPDSEDMFINLTNGTCNVVTGLPKVIYELRARNAGFIGEYVMGSHLFSRDPVSLVTRNDDAEFGDFVNWVLRALVAAEAMNITQSTAESFPTTSLFGEQYEHMFQNAIAAVGNYGEIYNLFLEDQVPRGVGGINSPHSGEDSGGLLYPTPFGALAAGEGDYDHEEHDHIFSSLGPIPGGTLETVSTSHVLRCGIIVDGKRNGLAGSSSSNRNMTEGEWDGIDVDYCRGLAAAVFAGDKTSDSLLLIAYKSPEEAFVALNDNQIDVLSGATYNLENDVSEPSTGVGFQFGLVYYYDEPREDGLNSTSTAIYPLSMATREDDVQWSEFVNLIIVSTIQAEANDIQQLAAIDMPTLDLFGPSFQQAIRDVILYVGNYAEIYERNMEQYIPRVNNTRNTLNNGESPMFFTGWEF